MKRWFNGIRIAKVDRIIMLNVAWDVNDSRF